MNLEDVEREALHYLGECENPLVQIDNLYRHVTARADSDVISLGDFTEFLEHHELVKVTDPLAYAESDTVLAALKGAGLPTQACAILVERVPSLRDLYVSMLEQLTTMTDALTRALKESRGTGDESRGEQIFRTLERIKKLKSKISDHLTSS